MPLYCGVNGVRREIRELYTGVGGVRKQLSEMWASEGGVKKLLYRAVKGTPIRDLPVGSIVKMGRYYDSDISWIVAEHNHAGYPSNSVTLFSEKIIKLCCMDAMESGGTSDRELYGNNVYSLSNIRQWLNKKGLLWYQSQHTFDREPSNNYVWKNYNEYSDEQGFLTGFSDDLRSIILPTDIVVAKPNYDGAGSEIITDSIFLLSSSEVGLGSENGISEGSRLELFSDNSSRKAFPTDLAVLNSEYKDSGLSSSVSWHYGLRSPNVSFQYYFRFVNSSGLLRYDDAYKGDMGIRPAMNVTDSALVDDSGFIVV